MGVSTCPSPLLSNWRLIGGVVFVWGWDWRWRVRLMVPMLIAVRREAGMMVESPQLEAKQTWTIYKVPRKAKGQPKPNVAGPVNFAFLF